MAIKVGDILIWTDNTSPSLGSIVKVLTIHQEKEDCFLYVEFLDVPLKSPRPVGHRDIFFDWRFEPLSIDSWEIYQSLSKIDRKIRQMDERFKLRNSHVK